MSASVTLFLIIAVVMYLALAVIALWGLFCVVTLWRRVSQKRFRSDAALLDFVEEVVPPLSRGDFNTVGQLCEADPRAMPQLVLLAVENRQIGFNKVRQLVVDRFQTDVLSDLESRLSWVNTVIKAAPMVGLFGTVVGMMGAFNKMGAGTDVDTGDFAIDIMTALITTACGLAIAIPLVICLASVNNRIRKMEEATSFGLTRFFEVYRNVVGK